MLRASYLGFKLSRVDSSNNNQYGAGGTQLPLLDQSISVSGNYDASNMPDSVSTLGDKRSLISAEATGASR